MEPLQTKNNLHSAVTLLHDIPCQSIKDLDKNLHLLCLGHETPSWRSCHVNPPSNNFSFSWANYFVGLRYGAADGQIEMQGGNEKTLKNNVTETNG